MNFFFFLSGFIMVIAYYKTLRESKSAVRIKYWINRFARIYPVYLIALVFMALYFWFIDRNVVSSFYVRMIFEIFLIQSWIGKSSINFPGWSLSVELLFYILFPFLLYLLAKVKEKRLLLIAVVLYLVSQSVYFLLTFKYGGDTRTAIAINYFPLLHLATFSCGVILGIVSIRWSDFFRKKPLITKAVSYTLVVVCFIALLLFTNFSKYHHDGLMTPVYFFFILGMSIESPVTKLLSNKFFVYLGDISYSVYILQYPVWLFFEAAMKHANVSAFFNFYLYLLVLVICSSVIYSFYEKPIQKWLQINLKKRWAIS